MYSQLHDTLTCQREQGKLHKVLPLDEGLQVVNDAKRRRISFLHGQATTQIVQSQEVSPGHLLIPAMLNGLSRFHIHMCIYLSIHT